LPKQRGTVKWFDRHKRYGFIIGEQGEQIFMRQNALYEADGRRPCEGQLALYHGRYPAKGPEVLNVELVETMRPSSRDTKER